jgi:hypothetical protein
MQGSECKPAALLEIVTPTQKTGSVKFTQVLESTGAGEGIRTLDPDLGKVVLYP